MLCAENREIQGDTRTHILQRERKKEKSAWVVHVYASCSCASFFVARKRMKERENEAKEADTKRDTKKDTREVGEKVMRENPRRTC